MCGPIHSDNDSSAIESRARSAVSTAKSQVEYFTRALNQWKENLAAREAKLAELTGTEVVTN